MKDTSLFGVCWMCFFKLSDRTSVWGGSEAPGLAIKYDLYLFPVGTARGPSPLQRLILAKPIDKTTNQITLQILLKCKFHRNKLIWIDLEL